MFLLGFWKYQNKSDVRIMYLYFNSYQNNLFQTKTSWLKNMKSEEYWSHLANEVDLLFRKLEEKMQMIFERFFNWTYTVHIFSFIYGFH